MVAIHNYAGNNRVNCGGACACPSIQREKLDGLVMDAIEAKLLARDRLRTLLAGASYVSRRRQADLTQRRSERKRRSTAISSLPILIEEGGNEAQDPAFVERMATNRATPAVVSSRIDVLKA